MKDLQQEELQMRINMDACVEKAVKGKKLALFKEMLEHNKYPGPGVVSELVDVASLIGEVAKTGMLPFKFTPALLTPEALANLLTYLFRLGFNQCNASLHFGSSKHSST